jgi:hypothetical protein
MKKLLIIIVFCFISLSNNAFAVKTLLSDPETYEKINMFCSNKYSVNPQLIWVCVDQQTESLGAIESYLNNKFPNVENDHPVIKMILSAAAKSTTEVNGKKWIDWSMLRYRFKISMQKWLLKKGDTMALYNLNAAL